MCVILKKITLSVAVIFLPLLTVSTAFSEDISTPESPISARFKKLNSDGTLTDCIVTGNETRKDWLILQEAGCTLETLRNNHDIDVEVTLKTNSGFRSILMTSKYYLMWLNSGLHAVAFLRNFPLAVTSLVTVHPLDSMIYLAFSGLYNIGLSRNANQTLYPFLGKHLSSFFYPEGQNKDSNNNEPESLGLGGHALIIGADLFMWWLEAPLFGFKINRLMLGLDLLHFTLDMAI